jgi:hypothetical protein
MTEMNSNHPFDLVPMPPGTSPLVNQIVPGVLKASHQGAGEGGDVELEERAIECFMVADAPLARQVGAVGRG